ncbi:hypothetical protein [Pantoea sp. A4]|uniref:hypothetical protein n=1 Tax=Pantoea sp. A4 TaxID=1225184 RepID=UPI000A7147A1|nr:hypothetical protein [Pantoea sp. A4]
MVSRFTLTAVVASSFLTACAQHSPGDASQFEGPSQVSITHVVTRTDDGSPVIVTIDGKEAGRLPGGQTTSFNLKPGSHEIGGYVQTLFGYGRVTITSLKINTNSNQLSEIDYRVVRAPGFKLVKQTKLTPPKPPEPKGEPLPVPQLEQVSTLQATGSSAQPVSATNTAGAATTEGGQTATPSTAATTPETTSTVTTGTVSTAGTTATTSGTATAASTSTSVTAPAASTTTTPASTAATTTTTPAATTSGSVTTTTPATTAATTGSTSSVTQATGTAVTTSSTDSTDASAATTDSTATISAASGTTTY